jgi:hypothetical protein
MLDQDCNNMEKVQYGLETASHSEVVFATYQEDNIKWMHRLMDRYLEADRG